MCEFLKKGTKLRDAVPISSACGRSNNWCQMGRPRGRKAHARGRAAQKRKQSEADAVGGTSTAPSADNEEAESSVTKLKDAFLLHGIPEEAKLRKLMQALPQPEEICNHASEQLKRTTRSLQQALHVYCLGGCNCVAVHGAGSKKALLEHIVPAAVPGAIAAISAYAYTSPSARDVALEALRAVSLAPDDVDEDTSAFDFDEVLHELHERLHNYRKKAASSSRKCRDPQMQPSYPWITVIVHSADWRTMRSREVMAGLAALSALDGVGLVLSFDHMNATSLLSSDTANRMRLMWCHANTYRWFRAEGENAGPLIFSTKVEHSAAMDAAGVLSGLTPNAQNVFKELAHEQLNHGKSFEGMAMNEWFERCRKRFLVSNELTLRAHLNEFLDHELVSVKRSQMGGDIVRIPLAPHAIESLLSTLGATQ